ncbi:hypothetical protein [Sinorhizobium medicae]
MKEESSVDIASDTLSGDLRDVMLTHIRTMETPWSKMSERQQQDKIYAVDKAAHDIVRRAVHMIAADQRDVLEVSVAKFTVADKIKMDVVGNVTSPNIETLADNRGRSALLIFVSPADYFGEREEAKADPDQPAIPFDDDEDEDAAEPVAETEAEAETDELPEVDPADVPVAAE